MNFYRATILGALVAVAASSAFAQSRGQRSPEISAGPVAQSAGDTTDWQQFVPATDGSFVTWGDAPPELGLVKRLFALAHTEECSWALGGSYDGSIADPEVYDIVYRESYDLKTDPDRLARLYRFFCNAGAYNEQHVYLLWDASFRLKPVLFAEPRIDTTYENDSGDAPVKSISVDGMVATSAVTNSWYDAEARTIFTHSCWRGMCDASSQAAYVFASATFVLRTYDADPSYDGKINPFRVYDTTTPNPVELVPVAEADMPVNPNWENED